MRAVVLAAPKTSPILGPEAVESTMAVTKRPKRPIPRGLPTLVSDKPLATSCSEPYIPCSADLLARLRKAVATTLLEPP